MFRLSHAMNYTLPLERNNNDMIFGTSVDVYPCSRRVSLFVFVEYYEYPHRVGRTGGAGGRSGRGTNHPCERDDDAVDEITLDCVVFSFAWESTPCHTYVDQKGAPTQG